MWIVSINVEEAITDQGALYELNRHKTPRGKYKVKISICIRKSYHRTDIEDICSIFDQVRPVVSHLKVRIPEKIPPQRKLVEVAALKKVVVENHKYEHPETIVRLD